MATFPVTTALTTETMPVLVHVMTIATNQEKLLARISSHQEPS